MAGFQPSVGPAFGQRGNGSGFAQAGKHRRARPASANGGGGTILLALFAARTYGVHGKEPHPVPAFQEVLRRFESYLRVERNLSPRTRTAYRGELERFVRFLAEEGRLPEDPDITAFETRHGEAYLQHLGHERHCRAATLSRTISTLRVFFRFAVETGLRDDNPMEELRRPRAGRKLPVYLLESELERLFGAPDTSEPRGVRDRCMMVLMAFCGLRLQEVVGLNLRDIDMNSRTLRVTGKGSKERLVPVNETAARELLAWLHVRMAADGERALFTNRFGRRLSGRMVEKIVDKYVRASGLSRKGLSPHKLRHTFATLLHSKDVDLVEIQALLGHASIATTQIYTHTNPARLQEAVDRLKVLEG